MTTTAPLQQPVSIRPVERSAWGVWFLCFLPFYYLVWYVKINKELAAFTGEKVGTFGLWFGQCIPIVSWIGLAHTSDRINKVRTAKGLPPLPTVGMTILSSLWYGSQTRYLQRRLNTTWHEIGAL
jgi:hypothetical protein